MIEIIRGAETSPGIWEYSVPSLALRGKSRQPLLDACRQLKSLYGLTAARVGLFREGSELADLSCPIEVGAATTVTERDKGTVKFEKYIDLAKVFHPEPAIAQG